eukprot:scaffold1616_cov310-Pinguiococcus_pyrenoidosus.AAC.35
MTKLVALALVGLLGCGLAAKDDKSLATLRSLSSRQSAIRLTQDSFYSLVRSVLSSRDIKPLADP